MNRIYIYFVVLGCVATTTLTLGANEKRFSPIMDLEDAIGVKVDRHTLGQKITDVLAFNRLLTDTERKKRLVVPIGPQYIEELDISVSGEMVDRVTLTAVLNHQAEKIPSVFLLDSACKTLKILPKRKKKGQLEKVISPYVTTPIGSHLISEGFGVGFASKDSLVNKDEISIDEWLALIKKFSKLGKVDRDNLFLVSTFENAELAIALAGRFYFAGVVIEAPRRVMFLDDQDSDEKSNDSEVVRSRYIKNIEQLKSPLLVVACKNSLSFPALKATLLRTLSESSATFQVSLLKEEARNYNRSKLSLDEVSNLNDSATIPRVYYNKKVFGKFTSSIIGFLKTYSTNGPVPLPAVEPDPLNEKPVVIRGVQEGPESEIGVVSLGMHDGYKSGEEEDESGGDE